MQPVEYLVDELAEADTIPKRRIGVVDLGSNSGRLVVYDQFPSGRLCIVEDARVPLRLASDIHTDGALGEAAMARTIDALREFHSIALGAGAERTVVVGTSSMREATNGDALRQRIREEVGVEVEIIDGLSEAHFSFLGAIHGLPVWNGFVLDIGGGSLELTRFRDRAGVASWMLPLGALRLTQEFILSDPADSKDVRHLKQFIAHRLREEGIPKADEYDVLVGTGGTIRNVAKINRKQRPSPIQRLHGYSVPYERVRRIASALSAADIDQRSAVPGLNSDRADSIVGGVIAVQVVMETLGVNELMVSGEGLREGIAFSLNSFEAPKPEAVKQASIAGLAYRFRAWEPGRARQRMAAARQIATMIDSDSPPEFHEILVQAAFVLDVGRSVDYYDRLNHTATIVLIADLDGFTHREIALLCAIIREADKRQSNFSQYDPLVTVDDIGPITRCGVILAIADEIERRYPGDAEIQLKLESDQDKVTMTIPPFSAYEIAKLGDRFRRAFGRELIFN